MRWYSFWFVPVSAAFAGGELLTPSAEEAFRFDLRPSIEAVVWSGDRPYAALMESDDPVFFAPRLGLDVDASAGDHWFFHAAARVDRGFDPGWQEDGDFRFDEIMLRWRACDDQRLNVQVGRFATVFGAWQAQHDFFDDPFLLAPLPYSQIIGIQTRDPAALSPAAIESRATGASPPVSALSKDKWASMIWGPSYGTGASVFGSTERFDYAAEIKNSGLSSHPDSWEDNGFDDPSFTARFGYRPDAAWAFGVSASHGPWMEEDVPGFDRGDFKQTTLGLDGRWAHRDFMVTGEIILTEFETPSAGDLRAASWFLGARWKAAPGFWLATRFGQILANEADGPAGSEVPWQPDVWRAELGCGWRITPTVLAKAGYSFTHTDHDDEAGEHLLGTGIGWRF